MLISVTNGRPTREQVEKVLTIVRGHKEGDIISHESFESAIGEPRKSDRYRTVLSAARRRLLRESNLVLVSERGIGYRIPPGFEQVKAGYRSINRGVRSIAHGTVVIGVVSDERLPDQRQRAARDQIVSQARYLAELAKTKRKELALHVGTTNGNPN